MKPSMKDWSIALPMKYNTTQITITIRSLPKNSPTVFRGFNGDGVEAPNKSRAVVGSTMD